MLNIMGGDLAWDGNKKGCYSSLGQFSLPIFNQSYKRFNFTTCINNYTNHFYLLNSLFDLDISYEVPVTIYFVRVKQ